jgi:hypothetical protein
VRRVAYPRFFRRYSKIPISRYHHDSKNRAHSGFLHLAWQKYLSEILPARIKDPTTGQENLVFPGSREELVERALRYLAVQQIAKPRLTPGIQTECQAVTVFFPLSMLRRHLEQLGHGFKLIEIKEALDILSGTMIEVFAPDERDVPRKGKSGKKGTRFVKATILSNYAGDYPQEDSTGEESIAAMTFHRSRRRRF